MANVTDYIKRMKNGELARTPEEKRTSPIAKYIHKREMASKAENTHDTKEKGRATAWTTSEATE